MSRVASVARTVPQGAWTAVCALVLIASLGFAVVLGAGLSVWTGAVASRARPVAPVVPAPGSGLVVVPGAHPQVRHQVTTTGAPPRLTVVRPPVAPPVSRSTHVQSPAHKPAAQQVTQPPTQPGPNDGQTPPPVLPPTQILVLLSEHGLVEKVAHTLRDVTSPNERDVDDDQVQIVNELGKAVAKGDATVVSPDQATLPTEAPAPESNPDAGADEVTGSAPGADTDLAVVGLTAGSTPDASIAVLAAPPAAPDLPASDPAEPTPAATAAPQPAAPVAQSQPVPTAQSHAGRHAQHKKAQHKKAQHKRAQHKRAEHQAKHAGGRHRH